MGNIEVNALPEYDNRYVKTKIETYGDKVYTNFCNLNVPEDCVECDYLTIISILQSLYGNIFRQLHL